MDNSHHARQERGSILVVTLLAMGLILGAFLYVALLGSRVARATRARSTADAVAMSAAVTKARVLNYEAFILMADAVLLPLGQLSENLATRQAALIRGACIGDPSCGPGSSYDLYHAGVAGAAPGVDQAVSRWMDGLEAMAAILEQVGPVWAEEEAVLAGTSSGGPGPVRYAASFPLPDRPECGKLGIDLVGNGALVQGRDACHARPFDSGLYLSSDFRDEDLLALGDLWIDQPGSACSKLDRVPSLASWWSEFRISRGMALEAGASDNFHVRRLQALRQADARPPSVLPFVLGIGCAEHYSWGHHGQESLWHMDWRARLVPCEMDQRWSQQQVLRCGGSSVSGADLIQRQFQVELDWLTGLSDQGTNESRNQLIQQTWKW